MVCVCVCVLGRCGGARCLLSGRRALRRGLGRWEGGSPHDGSDMTRLKGQGYRGVPLAPCIVPMGRVPPPATP